jgi:hypothetical protein
LSLIISNYLVVKRHYKEDGVDASGDMEDTFGAEEAVAVAKREPGRRCLDEDRIRRRADDSCGEAHRCAGAGMSRESRRMAGLLLILLPTVIYGGTTILSMLVGDPAYSENHLRQDLWRAGHAHAGVLLILSLVALRYVDEAELPQRMRRLVRHSIPALAVPLSAAFFLSVLSPDATKPSAFIYLAYVGAVSLAAGVLTLGIGLIRDPSRSVTARKEE